MPLEERKGVVGMKAQRADILPAGIIVLDEALEILGQDAVVATTADLLLGILLQERDAGGQRSPALARSELEGDFVNERHANTRAHRESHCRRAPAARARRQRKARPNDDRARLEEISVRLDQYWDLLRQRRARRDAGQDPDVAHLRTGEVVEHYQQ